MFKKFICLLLCLALFSFSSSFCQASAAVHEHDDSCYAGEKHVHIGDETVRDGCYCGA